MAHLSRSESQPSLPEDLQQATADPPFHDQEAGADIILRTSDGVDFYTHKTILCLVSPFFKTMFQLPQPANSALVVDVPETSRILGIILRASYPFGSSISRFQELGDIEQVLEAALKYDMDAMVSVARRRLLNQCPLRMFVLGCRLNREDICQSAATTLLSHRLQSLDSEVLHRISGHQYHILTQWHSRCCEAASNAVSTRSWFTPCGVLKKTPGCDCWVQDSRSQDWYAPTCVWQYLEDARNVVASCPSSKAAVRKSILRPLIAWSTARNGCATTTARADYWGSVHYLAKTLLALAVDRAVAEIPMPKFCDE
ncbi:hypothetical protein DENSPDRAFT_844117 [Dentipellis sp. KUC8613]|nr:hypothetical protein DENSPDRAFT_844117 [Dentipellis sp. KUC8613]